MSFKHKKVQLGNILPIQKIPILRNLEYKKYFIVPGEILNNSLRNCTIITILDIASLRIFRFDFDSHRSEKYKNFKSL